MKKSELKKENKNLEKELKVLQRKVFSLVNLYFKLNKVKLSDLSLHPQLFINILDEHSETARQVERVFPDRRKLEELLPLDYKGKTGNIKMSASMKRSLATHDDFLVRHGIESAEEQYKKRQMTEKNPEAIYWFKSNVLKPFISHYNRKVIKKYPELDEVCSFNINMGIRKNLAPGTLLHRNSVSSLMGFKRQDGEEDMVKTFFISRKVQPQTIDEKLDFIKKMMTFIYANKNLLDSYDIKYLSIQTPLDTVRIADLIETFPPDDN